MILLVLLVTFVTSIATGIMTVSLLQQAPVEVTRTIDNVIEKTIQQVTPTAISNIIAPQTQQSKQVTTVVVNEDDQVTGTISKNLKSIVRINQTDINGYVTFYGLGVVMSADGVIATSKGNIMSDSVYIAKFSDGAEWKLIPLSGSDNGDFFFRVNLPATTTYTFSPAQIASADLQLGQTIIGIGGDSSNAVAVGRVISLDTKNNIIGTTTTKYIDSVETDTSFKNISDGSSFFNLSGNLVGLKLSQTGSGAFTPISIVSGDLPATKK